MTHTDSLRDVISDDKVTITTSEGTTFSAECTERSMQVAPPQSGAVREVQRWHFVASNGDEIVAQITDGLKSTPSGPDFPIHEEAWNMSGEYEMGYITNIERNT